MSIKLKGSTDGSVTLQAPADTSPTGTDKTFTLPTQDGDAGQILKTDGSGALSFTDNLASGRNLLINADMRIDQRNSGSSIALTTTSFPVDRWLVREYSDGTATGEQVTDTPNNEFKYSLKYTVGTADSSLAGDQYGDLQQRIEGHNSAFLGFGTSGAQSITISFWVKSSVAGTYYVTVHNAAFNRSYPKSYTVEANETNTWLHKTLTIPGDTSGTWLTDNGVGVLVTWCVGVGSTYQATANQWNASGAIGASDQTNLLGTAGATFFLTGCQVEAGSVATKFEHKNYGDELARCQRYYETHNSTTTAKTTDGAVTSQWSTITSNDSSTLVVSTGIVYKVPKRASPTVTLYNPNDTSTAARVNAQGTERTVTGTYGGPNALTRIYVSGASSGNYVTYNWEASAEL